MTGLRWHDDKARTARLKPGGYLSFWRVTGHWEVTQKAAEQFGFSSPAIAILRDAAQDPDFYEFSTPAAHAQTPDEVDRLAAGPGRDRAVADAIGAYGGWCLDRYVKLRAAVRDDDLRHALYWLGYLLHAIQDLAPHAGRTNGEHAAEKDSPDEEPAAVDLARHYTCRALRAIRDGLGPARFDDLRAYAGEGTLGKAEKERLLGRDWDLDNGLAAYKRQGRWWAAQSPTPAAVRWPRERVIGQVLEEIGDGARAPRKVALPERPSAFPAPTFEPLVPPPSLGRARWTVMVYMAGDDSSRDGIEYAVRQDLGELKRIGSTDEVHFIAQTDECTHRDSYRYRLRRDTTLVADRLEVFRGDLNTGRVSTLVDFVRWAQERFPAERYALVLWGHGSGHDDQDVYRLARGSVSPRLATQLAHRRLGFFGATRRALLERSGPSRGYGFDDTAADFLDNVELKRALEQIRATLGRPLDLLGFDACLMAMTEVAYQLRGVTEVFVASERSEPGDGWSYGEGFKELVRDSSRSAAALGRDLVRSYQRSYGGVETLTAFDLHAIEPLVKELRELAGKIDGATYHQARRSAINCDRGGDGYRDLDTFLRALGPVARPARDALGQGVIDSCGPSRGLTVYAPADYRPDEPGGTDELYQQLDFARSGGWAPLLTRVFPSLPESPRRRAGNGHCVEGPLYALDRYTAGDVLTAVTDRSWERWSDPVRREVLGPLRPLARHALAPKAAAAPVEAAGAADDVRIFLLPGIMGSLLSDRTGHHGLVWIDPLGLAVGTDFEALRLRSDGLADADSGVGIQAVAPVPVVYDRLALALLATFGPVVEQVGYDWRRSLDQLGAEVAARLRASLLAAPGRRIAIVAHSMGGLVAAAALRRLGGLRERVAGLVALGTPWRGSCQAALNLRGDSDSLHTFSRLTNHPLDVVLEVVQSFWGLCDLLPPESPYLHDPSTYAAGPLARSASAAAQLQGSVAFDRSPLPVPTMVVVSDAHPTVTALSPSNGTLERELGPGDGSVSLRSATGIGGITRIVAVGAPHVALPLDGHAIRETTSQLGAWLRGGPPRRGPALPLDLPLPALRAPDRATLLARLEEPEHDPLQVGDLTALLPLLGG